MAREHERPPSAPTSLRPRILLALAAIGTLLAIAGLAPGETALESLSGRIVLDLPSWLGIPFLVVLFAMTAIILWLTAPGRHRRERKAASRPASTLALALLLLIALSLWGGLRELLLDIGELVRGFMERAGAASAPPAVQAVAPPDEVQSALVSGVMETLLLALCLILFGVVVWLYLALLPQRVDGASPVPAIPALGTAVEESLEDLRHMPDARLAIIRCYDRFERVLAAGADVRRPPWETALEFMRTALAHPRLPREAVRELTHLFEVARFSRHEIGAAHRERAWRALMAVRAALTDNDDHVAA